MARAVVTPVAAAAALELLDLVLPGRPLDRFGITPRTLHGLVGIPLAPLLHGGFGHLAANTGPYLVLGSLLASRSVAEYRRVVVLVTLLGGALVWAFARGGATHLGASGVVFGLLGYQLALGFTERRVASIILSVLVALAYGGLLASALPTHPSISFESHLAGLVVGVGLASRRRQQS